MKEGRGRVKTHKEEYRHVPSEPFIVLPRWITSKLRFHLRALSLVYKTFIFSRFIKFAYAVFLLFGGGESVRKMKSTFSPVRNRIFVLITNIFLSLLFVLDFFLFIFFSFFKFLFCDIKILHSMSFCYYFYSQFI